MLRHRDVLPIAGTSFNPEAWCPDCAFFKLRRTPKKRSPEDYRLLEVPQASPPCLQDPDVSSLKSEVSSDLRPET
jgi:hypothetical protein